MELTEAVARRLVASRGHEFDRLCEVAGAAAYEACRVLRRDLRGGERPRWESASHEHRQRWMARARAMGLGRVGSVRALYALALRLEQADAVERAWEGLLDWRLMELAVEYATLKLVMGSHLPEAVGPVLADARSAE